MFGPLSDSWTRVYWGGQLPGALAQAWRAELPAPAMPHEGKPLPRARSRSTCRIGGTHCGIAFQLGAAKHSSTRQPSTARAAVGARSAKVSNKPVAALVSVLTKLLARPAASAERSLRVLACDGWSMVKSFMSALFLMRHFLPAL